MAIRRGATYRLLYGDIEGDRISRAHGLAVRAGTILQKIIQEMAPQAQYQSKLKDPAMDRVLRADIVYSGKAIELKLGYEFDTKKAAKEIEDIRQFARLISVREGVLIRPTICLFQAENQDELLGFKADTSAIDLITGHQLCELLSIDYATVLRSVHDEAMRKLDAS